MRIHLLGWISRRDDTIHLCDKGGVTTSDSARYYVSDKPHKYAETHPEDWKDIAVDIRDSESKKGLYITIKCGSSSPTTYFKYWT